MRTLDHQDANVELDTQLLGPLPIVNAFRDRLGLPALLAQYLPGSDARLKLAPATAVGAVVANLVLHRQPVYALGEWAAPFDPALLGLGPGEAGLLNDDRVGRMLARLFDADRASLLTRLVLGAVQRFDIDVDQLHNDSTSIELSGAYPDGDGRARGSKPTAKIARGHSKDFRPDLLTELRRVLDRHGVRGGGGAPMVCPCERERRRGKGSGVLGGAIGGVAGGDRRPVGAVPAR